NQFTEARFGGRPPLRPSFCFRFIQKRCLLTIRSWRLSSKAHSIGAVESGRSRSETSSAAWRTWRLALQAPVKRQGLMETSDGTLDSLVRLFDQRHCIQLRSGNFLSSPVRPDHFQLVKL